MLYISCKFCDLESELQSYEQNMQKIYLSSLACSLDRELFGYSAAQCVVLCSHYTGGFTLKTHQMFSSMQRRRNLKATSIGHFGFVSEENSVSESTFPFTRKRKAGVCKFIVLTIEMKLHFKIYPTSVVWALPI